MCTLRSVRGIALISAAILTCTLAAGCLEGEKSADVLYDAIKDQFSILITFQRIRGGVAPGLVFVQPDKLRAPSDGYDPQKDFKSLVSLYQNRDHLLLPPGSFRTYYGFLGLEFQTFIRLSDHQIANAFVDTATPALAFTVPFSLNEVQILPGSFFYGSDGTLSYYHQMIVPGKFINAMAGAVNDYLKANPPAQLVEAIDHELESRKTSHRHPQWIEYRMALISNVSKGTFITGEQWPAGCPYETASLTSLRDALINGKILIHRRGGQLFMHVPLTDADMRETMAFISLYRRAVDTAAAELSQSNPGSTQPANMAVAIARSTLHSLTLTAAGSRTLEISLDIPRLFDGFPHASDPLPKLDAEQQDRAHELAKLAAAQLPIDSTLTLDKVVKAFHDGTLKVNQSEHPVAPGTGFQITTQPAQ